MTDTVKAILSECTVDELLDELTSRCTSFAIGVIKRDGYGGGDTRILVSPENFCESLGLIKILNKQSDHMTDAWLNNGNDDDYSDGEDDYDVPEF